MDRIDLDILELLQKNARTTQSEIARKVGLSQPSVAERISKLEESQVITGYVALIDAKKLGRDITAFISVDIEHPRFFEGFSKKVLNMPEILECMRVAGDESFVLKVRTENTSTLDKLLVDKLRTIPGVTRTNTTIVLASVKEEIRISTKTEVRSNEYQC